MALTEFDFSVVVERPAELDGCVIAVTGEIDLSTAPAFEKELLAAIEGGDRVVVIDLTATTFIDSTFLSSLVSAERRMTERRGRLLVVVNDPSLRKVFTITGLDRIYVLVERRDEAIRIASRAG